MSVRHCLDAMTGQARASTSTVWRHQGCEKGCQCLLLVLLLLLGAAAGARAVRGESVCVGAVLIEGNKGTSQVHGPRRQHTTIQAGPGPKDDHRQDQAPVQHVCV